MKKLSISMILTSLFIGFFYAGWFLNNIKNTTNISEVLSVQTTPTPTPLAVYEVESLSKTDIDAGTIEISDTIDEQKEYTSYLFEHKFTAKPGSEEKNTTTGQINIPISKDGDKKYPIILMIRGYVDTTIYETGIGTRAGADYFARNGFITVAPDFLGYAGSTTQAADIFESRFQTYTTVLSVLNSLQSIKEWDGKNIFIWAHSNGGQIALTTLVVTGENIPTVLWAPVTKPFPYSVLYYTDESIDGGKYIRNELSKFEELYDVDLFSFNNYLDNIQAPIQLHQGGADDAVPIDWSNAFVKRLEAKDKDITYFIYPSSDHNLRPDWDTVISRDLDFFADHLKSAKE